MEIEGYQLEKTDTKCPYLDNLVFSSKNLIINLIDEEGLEALLEAGYRHFGEYFFKPECNCCKECRAIRIPINAYCFSRSEKRVFKKNFHFAVNLIDNPIPNRAYYQLYLEHKKRFKNADLESYENWVRSFFSDHTFNKILEVWDEKKLVAVTHLDVTRKIVSAVYCYWNEIYSSFSPGKFSILQGFKFALDIGVEYYYLGYYIKENKHMAYKANYKPNQILKDGIWR